MLGTRTVDQGQKDEPTFNTAGLTFTWSMQCVLCSEIRHCILHWNSSEPSQIKEKKSCFSNVLSGDWEILWLTLTKGVPPRPRFHCAILSTANRCCCEGRRAARSSPWRIWPCGSGWPGNYVLRELLSPEWFDFVGSELGTTESLSKPPKVSNLVLLLTTGGLFGRGISLAGKMAVDFWDGCGCFFTFLGRSVCSVCSQKSPLSYPILSTPKFILLVPLDAIWIAW